MTEKERNKKLASLYWRVGKEYQELALLHDPFIATPAPDADIRYEILAKAFYHDTGIVAPRKIQTVDEGSRGYSFEERQNAWRKWIKENDVPEPAPDVPAGTTAVALVEALKPFAKAAEEYKSSLPRPIPEDALDGCVEIELGFCENARQAIDAYQKAVDADHEKAVR